MIDPTPGPWGYRIATGTADTMISSQVAKEAVAVIPFRYGTPERRAANRALILAAPDMLKEHEHDLDQIQLIEAWLIRAGYPPSNPAMAAVGEMVKAKRAVITKARGGK